MEHSQWRANILKEIESCENPVQLSKINFVPIRTAPGNNENVSNIILLVNNTEHVGLGKPFIQEIGDKNQPPEKMCLISTILINTRPISIVIMDYHSEISLEYNFLSNEKTKSIDLFHFISVIIMNQEDFFKEPEMILIGTKTSGEKPKVKIRNLFGKKSKYVHLMIKINL